jgi:hypothetical protein
MNGWYLGRFAKFATKQILTCSKYSVQIENQLINRLSGYLGAFYVVAAHITAWLDDQLIAGCGGAIATMFKRFSKLYLYLQKLSLQKHLAWTYVMMVLVFIGWMMWR